MSRTKNRNEHNSILRILTATTSKSGNTCMHTHTQSVRDHTSAKTRNSREARHQQLETCHAYLYARRAILSQCFFALFFFDNFLPSII